ncbi:MAG: hypothetical protein ACM3U2_07130 [Deltaproteobacteria bacterium]
MTESLRALLAGAIDYAGMFPPAGLPLEQALAKYEEHCHGNEALLLGRFVFPLAKLADFEHVHPFYRSIHLSAVVKVGDTESHFVEGLDEAVTHLRGYHRTGYIDAVEVRSPAALMWDPFFIVGTATGRFQSAKRRHLKIFVECPSAESLRQEPGWERVVDGFVTVLESHNNLMATLPENPFPTGFKLRCGGVRQSEIPSTEAIAKVICSCRDHGVFWKATAGLHHPFRHVDPELGVPMHGFINLLTAAVMADVHRLDTRQVQDILEDDDPGHFRFTNEALTWRDLSATVLQIAAARERALRSFGSCSIDEPWQDLTVLGLL